MFRGLIGKATRWLSLGVVAVALGACGGGSNTCSNDPFDGNACSDDDDGGSGPIPVASDLVLTLSANTIVNSGTASVTATVTALDENRVALPDVPVTLSADNDGIVTLSSTPAVTDESGVVTGEVSIGSNLATRVIVVTATSGSITRTTNLVVTSGPSSAVPASIELIAAATTVGTGGNAVGITAFVKDANNNTMPATPVTFTTSTGTLSDVSSMTDGSGAATANLSAGSDKSNRTATITVSSGTIQAQLALPITGSKLTVSGPSTLTLSNTATYSVTAVDSNGNALPNVVITPTSTLGNALAPSSATTDANGQVSINYTATNSGADTVRFAGAGTSTSVSVTISGEDFLFISPAASTTVDIGESQTLQVRYRIGGVAQAGEAINFAATGGALSAATVTTNASGVATVSITASSAGPVIVQASLAGGSASATLPLTFVATVPDKLVLQVTPTALAPNTDGTTTNQAQVVAKVTDANDNPVQGKVVNFSRVTDPSGGSLLQASATTDVNGQATVPYAAGPESTATNAVVLRGTVAEDTSVTGTASLTVNQTALFITLGTGNVIENVDEQTYRKNWVVYVTDANGIAVSGVSVTMKALPTHYYTGRLAWFDPVWDWSSPIYRCENEDTDSDGILDPGEDANGDGVLWPGNVVAVTPGTVQTDSTGRATVSLLYGESYAPWVRLRLTATARVSGTEAKRDAEFILNGFADDFNQEDVPPAGVVSPFGTSGTAGCVQVQ